MSLIDVARDTLKEIPMADILRERLSLALDQSAMLERQIGEFQSKAAKLEVQLEIVTLDRDKAKDELRQFQIEHAEETRIVSGIEFRKGKRTSNQWLPFCPKCHLPANECDATGGGYYIRCLGSCGWDGVVIQHPIDTFASRIV